MWVVVKNHKLKLYIMSRYLYGAAVQGIQGFIFKTNELKHIAIEASKAKIIYTGSRDYPVSPDEPYDLIIKTKKRRNAEDNPYRKGVRCFVRLNKFMNEFGYSVTAANIENSGKIEYLNQCADEAGMSVEDWLEIKENEQKFIDRFNNYNKGKRAFLSENEEYLI